MKRADLTPEEVEEMRAEGVELTDEDLEGVERQTNKDILLQLVYGLKWSNSMRDKGAKLDRQELIWAQIRDIALDELVLIRREMKKMGKEVK